MNKVLFSSKSDIWQTPKELYVLNFYYEIPQFCLIDKECYKLL